MPGGGREPPRNVKPDPPRAVQVWLRKFEDGTQDVNYQYHNKAPASGWHGEWQYWWDGECGHYLSRPRKPNM